MLIQSQNAAHLFTDTIFAISGCFVIVTGLAKAMYLQALFPAEHTSLCLILGMAPSAFDAA
jgi:hypothetical protein